MEVWKELGKLMNKVFTKNDIYEAEDFNRINDVAYRAYIQFKKSGVYTALDYVDKTTIEESTLISTSTFNIIETDLKHTDIIGNFNKKYWNERMVFDYTDANRWERQADILETLINNIQTTMPLCGCGGCGGTDELY